MAYKLRTKHPEYYLVRPKEGMMNKNESVTIEIHVDKKASPDQKVLETDKFMLMVAPTNDREYSSSLWTKLRPPDMFRLKFPISDSNDLKSPQNFLESSSDQDSSMYGSVRMPDDPMRSSSNMSFGDSKSEAKPPKFKFSLNVPHFLEKHDEKADEDHLEFLKSRISLQESQISKAKNDIQQLKSSLRGIGFDEEKKKSSIFSFFVLILIFLVGGLLLKLRMDSLESDIEV